MAGSLPRQFKWIFWLVKSIIRREPPIFLTLALPIKCNGFLKNKRAAVFQQPPLFIYPRFSRRRSAWSSGTPVARISKGCSTRPEGQNSEIVLNFFALLKNSSLILGGFYTEFSFSKREIRKSQPQKCPVFQLTCDFENFFGCYETTRLHEILWKRRRAPSGRPSISSNV